MGRRKQFSANVAAGCDAGPTIIEAIRAARAFAESACLDDKRRAKLSVIIEELVSNILRHGANGEDVSLHFTLTEAALLDGKSVAVEIADNAAAFDPVNDFQYEAPVRTSEGGAGLEIVKSWASDLSYRREGGWNCLQLRLN